MRTLHRPKYLHNFVMLLKDTMIIVLYAGNKTEYHCCKNYSLSGCSALELSVLNEEREQSADAYDNSPLCICRLNRSVMYFE